ncbi:hypothetical protein JR316_0004272 [Psilocybe cubensis]|uniref:Uncharacterized protein n=2 Tax=Psilocybe cubensis TaxID=181762 RepID=A0ACB8H3D4_PSICU|nr:hypothetical protein JR316_0004272 [Psilocybe cubensis]KAH9482177.1 hypothetical protein JR316_0004272 [Psilocybe cubensis]
MRSTTLAKNWVIHQIPEDVWQEIFKIAVLENPEIDIASTSSRVVDNSLRLSHVCSRFYNIVADIPDLWTDIALRIDRHGNSSPKQELIVLAFKRASTKPLTLNLAYTTASLRNNASPVYLTSSSNIRDAVKRRYALPAFWNFALNIHRAQKMRIDAQLLNTTCIGCRNPAKRFQWRATSDLIFVKHYAPILETLEIVGSVRHPSPDEYKIGLYDKGLAPFVRRTVQMSPKLHTLIRRQPTSGRPVLVHDTQMYFRNLVNLEILEGYIFVSELYLVLSSTRALERCNAGRLLGVIPAQSRIRNLPFLRELTLIGYVADDIRGNSPLTRILSLIRAPLLNKLVLRRDRKWIQEDFITFISRCELTLEHLVLDRDQSTEQEKLEFLCLLPNLKSLELHSTYDCEQEDDGPHLLTDAFAKCLTTWDTSKGEFSICPVLESFGYDKDGVEVDSDDPVLSSMIEYRWNGAPGKKYLKAVSVCGVGRSLLYDIRRLLVLQKEGLKVTFYDDPCSMKLVCRD